MEGRAIVSAEGAANVGKLMLLTSNKEGPNTGGENDTNPIPVRDVGEANVAVVGFQGGRHLQEQEAGSRQLCAVLLLAEGARTHGQGDDGHDGDECEERGMDEADEAVGNLQVGGEQGSALRTSHYCCTCHCFRVRLDECCSFSPLLYQPLLASAGAPPAKQRRKED